MTPHTNLIRLHGRRRAWATAAGALVVTGGLAGLWFAGGALAQTSPASGWPAKKAARYDNQQSALSQAQAHPTPKSQVAAPPGPGHTVKQAPITGIISTHQGPFSPQQFAVSNVWTAYVNGHYYTVYAGSEQHPRSGAPAQAGIMLYSDPANVNSGMRPTRLGIYLAGTNKSPLAVIGADGSTVRLSNRYGQVVTLNIAGRSFG